MFLILSGVIWVVTASGSCRSLEGRVPYTGRIGAELVMRRKLEQDYQQRLAYLNDELMELVREVLKT